MKKKASILHYTDQGEGENLIFLHGFLENLKMWDFLLPSLENRRVITIDLPGHGQSKITEKKLTIDGIAQAIHILLKQLIPNEKYTLIGHSLGGYVALHIAAIEKKNLKKILLFHSHPWEDGKIKKENRTRISKIVEHDPAIFIKTAIPNLYYRKKQYSKEIKEQIAYALTLKKEDIQQNLIAMRDRKEQLQLFKDLGDRIHVIQGEYDSLIDSHKMERLTKTSNSYYHFISNVGHMSHIESREEVIQLFREII